MAFTPEQQKKLRSFRNWLLGVQNDGSAEMATEVSVEFNEVAAILGLDPIPDPYAGVGHDQPTCRECGEPCFVTNAGVSHHYAADSPDDVDHAADADHVAIPEEEE